jgi:hypothetical protein
MPIHDSDWSLQFFEGVACPADVHIPAADSDAWQWNPRHRWVYDKLAVAASQDIQAAPFGVEPPGYPVFCKPMMNLEGMGTGSAVLHDADDYERLCRPGHMWMKLLSGDHVSSDAALVEGKPGWWRHATGVAAGAGMFDYWTVHAGAPGGLEAYLERWIGRHLAGYSGMVNFETIGGRIIEVHLRITDQWPDLYGGRAWVEALVGLYGQKRWRFAGETRRTGYSVALFGPPRRDYRHPPAGLGQELRAAAGISSLQITFHEGKAPGWHANPPGGFRLAVINGFDLAACRAARRRLAGWYGIATPPNIVTE